MTMIEQMTAWDPATNPLPGSINLWRSRGPNIYLTLWHVCIDNVELLGGARSFLSEQITIEGVSL